MHSNFKPHDKSQRLDIPLRAIFPEYYSKNFLVRWLFSKRLYVAIEYLRKINPDTLIDIGCGDGYFINLINNQGLRLKKIWGIDLNPNVVQLNNQINNCFFKHQNILKTDFPEQIFDVAVCADILEHVEKIEKAIVEIRRILAPHSYLITSAPVESVIYKSLRFLLKGTYSQESGPNAGKHYYNAKQIDNIIRRKGFIRVLSKKIPFYAPFDLFHLNLYQKI